MSVISVDEVPEEVLQEAVDTTYELGRQAGRSLVKVGLLTGIGGLAIGSAVSYFLTRRILETKYNKIAEDEIAVMREHYQSKMVALENTSGKDNLDDLVQERGYLVEEAAPPMAVSPPTSVVVAAEEAQDEVEVLPEPVVKEPPPAEEVIRNVFEEAQMMNSWDYNKERAKRSPVRPYVIHVDEREELPYDEVSLTYYDADDVLCDERDEVIGGPDRDRMVGEANLEKFGHGSNDPSVVFVRNDRLEAQYEIIKSPNSYAEEVHGFEHADTRRHRRERKSFDDE